MAPPALPRVPRFLRILCTILSTASPSVMAWSACGTYFQIHDVARLEKEVMPKYFKHGKFASFQRQLNNFGFRKWTKTRATVCTFSHASIVRGTLAADPVSTASSDQRSTTRKRQRVDADLPVSKTAKLEDCMKDDGAVVDLWTMEWSSFCSDDEHPEIDEDTVGLPIDLFFYERVKPLKSLDLEPLVDVEAACQMEEHEWQLLVECLEA